MHRRAGNQLIGKIQTALGTSLVSLLLGLASLLLVLASVELCLTLLGKEAIQDSLQLYVTIVDSLLVVLAGLIVALLALLYESSWQGISVKTRPPDREKPARRVSDPLEHLASLDGPTADIDQMLREIEAGRM